MKKITYLLAILLVFQVGNGFSQTTDKELVYAAIEDYVDGIYLVQPERIKKSVHPELMKKGFWRKDGNTDYDKESIMTFDQLVDLASKWNAKGTLPKDAPRKIEIHDVKIPFYLSMRWVWFAPYLTVKYINRNIRKDIRTNRSLVGLDFGAILGSTWGFIFEYSNLFDLGSSYQSKQISVGYFYDY